ncbi:MAG: hypothetical protein V1936_04370 [Patescibacteria group bacterium]
MPDFEFPGCEAYKLIISVDAQISREALHACLDLKGRQTLPGKNKIHAAVGRALLLKRRGVSEGTT